MNDEALHDLLNCYQIWLPGLPWVVFSPLDKTETIGLLVHEYHSIPKF